MIVIWGFNLRTTLLWYKLFLETVSISKNNSLWNVLLLLVMNLMCTDRKQIRDCLMPGAQVTELTRELGMIEKLSSLWWWLQRCINFSKHIKQFTLKIDTFYSMQIRTQFYVFDVILVWISNKFNLTSIWWFQAEVLNPFVPWMTIW